ncbi:uncharacterized protein [Nicotiana tomentosiformis]|uniref:uncharacterized protein n=1 Tax=Nicotiana tomentosiformis TaxID=4098 RepID=UPI00388CD838
MRSILNNDDVSSTPDGFIPFSLDPSHPLYIHPSDNPGSQLVSVPFNESGFVLWRSSMVTSLSAKNKLGLVDGRVSRPIQDSPYYAYWERCNDMVKSWITNSVSREIATSMMCFRTAKEVWKDINDRFGQSNGSKYIQLQREIHSATQGSSDIASYFTKMRSLWDELHSSYVGHVCSCGALPKFIEDQQLFQFLNGLNDSYSTVKSAIMMMNPLPPMSKAYSLLQHNESQREAHSSVPSISGDTFSFLVSPGSSNGNRTFSQKVNFESRRSNTNASCKYYKKPGHTVDKCYMLHGFPTDFKFTKNKKSASCVQTEPPFTLSTHLHGILTTQLSESSAHGFTKEQYQHLLALFQQAQLSSGLTHDDSSVNNTAFAYFASLFSSYVESSVDSHVCASSQLKVNPWILDTGATNHMTPHKHLLFNVKPLTKPFLVTLPNGYKAKVVSTGYLHLRHDVVLLHVLLGPSLKWPLEIGKAAGRLYYLYPDADHFSVTSTSMSVSHSYVSLPISAHSVNISHVVDHVVDFVSLYLFDHSSSSSSSSSDSSSTPPFISLRKSSRPVQQHVYLKDYVCSSVLAPTFTPHTKVSSNPSWQEARLKEFQALEANQTWEIVPLPPHKKAIPCKWVYKIKQKADGSIERYKARLLDVNNAFLHGDLHEEVYMKVRPGLDISGSSSSSTLVCKLKKSLYGLRQASRQWFFKLSEALLSKGYISSLNDYSLFTKSTSDSLVVLAVYVDDILLAKNDLSEMQSLKSYLDATFKIKDLGLVHYFLGLEISLHPQGYIMSQQKFTSDLLYEFNCQHFSSVLTPLDPSVKLTMDIGEPISNPSLYRRLVGKLNFLQNTRPDISFSVHHLS